jgi:hypothetical protein
VGDEGTPRARLLGRDDDGGQLAQRLQQEKPLIIHSACCFFSAFSAVNLV